MGKLSKVLVGIALTPIALLVIGIGGCEVIKAYYDREVTKMCEKDGGVTVYERVVLNADLFAKMKGHISGTPVVPSESLGVTDIPVFLRQHDLRIRDGNPRLTRSEAQIVRRFDEKIIAKSVRYSRSGGDFPFTLSHPSRYSCPVGGELEQKAFLVEGAAK